MAGPFDEDDTQYDYAPDDAQQPDVFGEGELDSILANEVAQPEQDDARRQISGEDGGLVSEADFGGGGDPVAASAAQAAAQDFQAEDPGVDIADGETGQAPVATGNLGGPKLAPATEPATGGLPFGADNFQGLGQSLRDANTATNAFAVELVDTTGKPYQDPRITRGGQPVRGITNYNAAPQFNAQPKASVIPNIQALNPAFQGVDLSKREASPENAVKYDQLDFIGWLGGKGQMAHYTEGDNKVRTALTNAYLQARLGANIPGYGRGRRLSPQDKAYEQEVKANVLGVNRQRIRGFTPEINRPELFGDNPEDTLRNVASHPVWNNPLMRDILEKGDDKQRARLLDAFFRDSVPRNAKARTELEAVKQKLLGDKDLWLSGGVPKPEGEKAKPAANQGWPRYLSDVAVGTTAAIAKIPSDLATAAGALTLFASAGTDGAAPIVEAGDQVADAMQRSLPARAGKVTGETLMAGGRKVSEWIDGVRDYLTSDPYSKQRKQQSEDVAKALGKDAPLLARLRDAIGSVQAGQVPELLLGSVAPSLVTGVGAAAAAGRLGASATTRTTAGLSAASAQTGGSAGVERLQQLLPKEGTLEYRTKFNEFKQSEYAKASAEQAASKGYTYDAEQDFKDNAYRLAAQKTLVDAATTYVTSKIFGGSLENLAASGTLASRVASGRGAAAASTAAQEFGQESLQAYIGNGLDAYQDSVVKEYQTTGDADKLMRAMTSAEVQAKALFEGTIGMFAGGAAGAARGGKAPQTPTSPSDPNALVPAVDPASQAAPSVLPPAAVVAPQTPATQTGPAAANNAAQARQQREAQEIQTIVTSLTPEAQQKHAEDKTLLDTFTSGLTHANDAEKARTETFLNRRLAEAYRSGDVDTALKKSAADYEKRAKKAASNITPADTQWNGFVQRLQADRQQKQAAMLAAVPSVDAEIGALVGDAAFNSGASKDPVTDGATVAKFKALAEPDRAALAVELQRVGNTVNPKALRKDVLAAIDYLAAGAVPKGTKTQGAKLAAAVLEARTVAAAQAQTTPVSEAAIERAKTLQQVLAESRQRRIEATERARALPQDNTPEAIQARAAEQAAARTEQQRLDAITAAAAQTRTLPEILGRPNRAPLPPTSSATPDATPELPPLTLEQAAKLPPVKAEPEAPKPAKTKTPTSNGKRTGRNNQSPLAPRPLDLNAATTIGDAAARTHQAIDAQVLQSNPNHVPLNLTVEYFDNDTDAQAEVPGLNNYTFSTYATTETDDTTGVRSSKIYVNLARLSSTTQLEDEIRGKVIGYYRLSDLVGPSAAEGLRTQLVGTAYQTAEGRKIWEDVQRDYRNNGFDERNEKTADGMANAYLMRVAALNRPLAKNLMDRVRDFLNRHFSRFFKYGTEFTSDDLIALFADVEAMRVSPLVDRARALGREFDTQNKKNRPDDLYATDRIGAAVASKYNDAEFMEQAIRDHMRNDPASQPWANRLLSLVTTRRGRIDQRLTENAQPIADDLSNEISRLAKEQSLTLEQVLKNLDDVALHRHIKELLAPNSAFTYERYRYGLTDSRRVAEINKFYREQLAADPSDANQRALGEQYRQELEDFALTYGKPPAELSYMGYTANTLNALLGSRDPRTYANALAIIDRATARSRENMIANGSLSRFEVAYQGLQYYVPKRGTQSGKPVNLDEELRASAKPRGQAVRQVAGRQTMVANVTEQVMQDLFVLEYVRVYTQIYTGLSQMANTNEQIGKNEDFPPVEMGRKGNGKATNDRQFGVHMAAPVDARRPYFRLPSGKLRQTTLRYMQLARLFDPTRLNNKGEVTVPGEGFGRWLADKGRGVSSAMGAVQTVWNPGFWAVMFWRDASLITKMALTRDAGFGGLDQAGRRVMAKTMLSRENWGTLRRFVAQAPENRDAFVQGLPQNNPVRRWVEAGGFHDAAAQFSASRFGAELKTDLAKERLADRVPGAAAARERLTSLKEGAELFAAVLDNVTRTAYHEAMLASGTDPSVALRIATETMNWSQTSDAARTFGVLYPFAKARATGQYQFTRRELWRKGEAPLVSTLRPDGKLERKLADNWVKEVNWPLVTWNVTASFAMVALAAMAWDDKNKPNAKELATKAVLPGVTVDGKPVMLPFQLGADRLTAGTGQLMAAAALGLITPGDAMREVAGMLVGELSPGTAPQIADETAPRTTAMASLVAATPIWAQWMVELGTNTTVFGGEVYKDDPFKRTTPSGSHRMGTPPEYVAAARWLNDKGFPMNVYPDAIPHLMQKAGFLGQAVDTVLKGAAQDKSAGEMIAKAGGLSKFQSQAGKYNALNEVRRFEAESVLPYRQRLNEAKRIGNTAAINALRERYPNWQAIEAYTTRDGALRKQETELRRSLAQGKARYSDIEALYDKNNAERLRIAGRVRAP